MNSDTKKPFDLTADDIMSLKPCHGYNKRRIIELCQQARTNGPEKVLLGLSRNDARWIVARLLRRNDRLQWAKACAERAKSYAQAAKASAAAFASDYADAAAFAAAAKASASASAYAYAAAAEYTDAAARYARRAADAAAYADAAANHSYFAAECANYAVEYAGHATNVVTAAKEHRTAMRHALSLLGY